MDPSSPALTASEPELAAALDDVERAKVDREAFGELYRAHAPAILSYLRRRTGDDAAAEDLLADTFLRSLTAIGRFRSRGVPLRHWLYRIATNLANSWARRERWRRLLFGGGTPDLERAQAAEKPALEVRAALAALSPADQAILVLRYLEGLSIDEVARVLDCPAGTVQSRTARARERLRERIERSEQR